MQTPINNKAQEFIPAPQPVSNAWQPTATTSGLNNDFPPLRKAAQPTGKYYPNPQANPTPPPSSNNDMAAFMTAMNTTNSLINLRELTRALNDFNALLSGCNSAAEKWAAALTFNSTINQYQL